MFSFPNYFTHSICSTIFFCQEDIVDEETLTKIRSELTVLNSMAEYQPFLFVEISTVLRSLGNIFYKPKTFMLIKRILSLY